MNLVAALPFAALGAVLGLDTVSFPQAMISRPIVAATLAGAFAGDAARGLALGAILELVALGTLPFGASRYPDWGNASVVGGAMYASGAAAPAGQLALALLAALLTAWVSSESMIVVRHANARWAQRARGALDSGDRRAVVGLQLRGLTADLVRGAIVTGGALLLLQPAFGAIAGQWNSGEATERAVIAGITAALGAGTIWTLVRGTSGTRLLILLGLAVGAALVA